MDACVKRMRSPNDMDVSLVRCDGKDECTECGKSKCRFATYECRTCGKQGISLQCARVETHSQKEKENMSKVGAKSSGQAKPDHKKPECGLKDSNCSTCGRRGHLRAARKSAGEPLELSVVTFPETSQDEADVGEVQAVMAETVPDTSCSAGSETACRDEIQVRTFAQNFEWFYEDHSAQELTFMCSDTVAMSSISTAASHALTTSMMLENTASANNARSRHGIATRNLPSEPCSQVVVHVKRDAF